jgi:hypothetical protein
MLPANTHGASAQGQKHGMGSHGRVSYERCFLARVEEAEPHIVIGTVCGENESDLGVRKLTRHGRQEGVIAPIGVEHHGGGIARVAGGRKSIDLKDAQRSLPKWRVKFCTPPPGRLHFDAPWGGLKKPETRDIESSMFANPLNLTRLMPA